MNLTDLDAEPIVDHEIVAQIRQLESVRSGLFRHLLDMFERNAGRTFAELDDWVAAGQLDTARAAFHSMKGTAGSLGARRLSRCAGMAESRCRGEAGPDSLDEVCRRARSEFATALVELNALP